MGRAYHPIFDHAGWAVVPSDPHAHHFSPGAAYPACRAWFDWGTPRLPQPASERCPACIVVLHERIAAMESALSEHDDEMLILSDLPRADRDYIGATLPRLRDALA